MATTIRMARGGTKKRPFYRIVVTDSRNPRDGNFIEKLGTYNPLLGRENPERVKYNAERMKHWVGVGAQISETVARFLRADGVIATKPNYTPKEKVAKLAPRAQARKDIADKAAAEAAEAAAAASAVPEAPAEAAPEAAAEGEAQA
ncbi:MAG: 30S ribosomal protein S16 [Rickettsiales bacterium]|nr:30S ribosomal protein S16 [Rickettsiales bacterium]